MLANWITLSRFPLLLANILILYLAPAPVRLAGVALLLVGLGLDTVDGMVARKTGQTTLFGSVLDIAADRTYELVLWVVFADLGLISVVIPLVVIARTTLTDAFRTIGISQGVAPFDQHRSRLGRFMVGSPFMRTGYSVSKIVTFTALTLGQALGGYPAGSTLAGAAPALLEGGQLVAWVALAFCVFRGLPVIISNLRRYWGMPLAGALALLALPPALRIQRAESSELGGAVARHRDHGGMHGYRAHTVIADGAIDGREDPRAGTGGAIGPIR